MSGAVPAMQFAVHHWIAPLAYVLTVWLRLIAAERGGTNQAEPSCDEIARITGALAVRLDRQGNVTEIGGDAEDLLGVRPLVLLGPGLFDRLHVTDRVAFLSMLDAACAGLGKQSLNARLRRSGKEAASGHVHCHCAILPATGEAALVLLSRNEAGNEHGAAEPGDGAATYLATVSHELRTPLNAIAGFAEMLRTGMCGPLADGRQKEYVELIGNSSQHLLSVVDSVLGASQGRKELFCLGEAVAMCFALLGSEAASRNVQLVKTIDPGIGEIMADRHVMQQILINLVANAIKFTPEGGKVSVAAELSGKSLILRVSDNGIGMTSHEVARAGTPFLRFAREEGVRVDGIGLGLSLVRGLVAMLGGALAIDSAPGRGTVVTIELPLMAESHPGSGPRKELEPEHEEKRRFA